MGPLVVGVPREIKDNERRVALTPDGVGELRHDGHRVLVQAGAGTGSRLQGNQSQKGQKRLMGSGRNAEGVARDPNKRSGRVSSK